MQAGQRALDQCAHQEAVAHLRQGLEVLRDVPDDSTRVHHELSLQAALGTALFVLRGPSPREVGEALSRARELSHQLGDFSQLVPVLRGFMFYYLVRGEIRLALDVGEQMLNFDQTQPDPQVRLLAHHSLGFVLFYHGDLVASYTHHQQVLALYTPELDLDLLTRFNARPGLICHSQMALELWQLGYADQAMHHSQVAMELGQKLGHAYGEAIRLLFTALLHQFRREPSAAQAQAAAGITLASEHRFTLLKRLL